jgi:hypothetical protein
MLGQFKVKPPNFKGISSALEVPVNFFIAIDTS